MKRIVKYANALTHLYGIVQVEKVVEIYNGQNKTQWSLQKAKMTLKENKEELERNFVYLHKDYVVHDVVFEEGNFEELVLNQQSKPFYIPEQNELLKYTNDYYVEETKEYEELKQYLLMNVFIGDTYTTEMVSEEIQGHCQFYYSLDIILELIVNKGARFKNQAQRNELVQRIVALANATRLRENNGFTPNELHDQMVKSGWMAVSKPVIKKVGRNDPCPCGSGKKYKKCCLDN